MNLMEFIDPKLKQKHRNRLAIGYVLLALLVGLATYILIMTAMGYQIFQRDGQVIQNGIIFLESKPVASDVYINGVKETEKTNVRLTLPEAEYEITLKAEGYKDWTKRLTLEGGRVLSIQYPRLFPTELASSDLKSYTGDGNGFFSQSPDKRWILFQSDTTSLEYNIIDTNSVNEPQKLGVLPADIIGAVEGKIGKIELIEWAADNKHFLIKHSSLNGIANFVIVDREDSSKSININSIFNLKPTRVSLIDNKIERVYLYFAEGGLLRTVDIKNKTLEGQVFDQVLEYKYIGNNRIMYATTKNSTSGKVNINAVNGDKTFLVGEVEFDATNSYLMDAGEYSGDWYYAIGSNKEEKISVYKNPQNFMNSDKDKTPNVLISIRSTPPLKLSISPQKRFILVQGTESFTTYDNEIKTTYRTTFEDNTVSGISWLDDFIVQYTAQGKLWLSEFDGKNKRDITVSKDSTLGFVNADFKRMYNLKSENGVIVSQLTSLLVETN